MFILKTFVTFMLVFLIFGLLGFLLDVVTGGRYAIRESLDEGRRIATTRVGRLLGWAKRTWLFSPVLAFLVLVSPALFVVFLVVYLVDVYVRAEVWYDDTTGTRFVPPLEPISDEMLRGPGLFRTASNWVNPPDKGTRSVRVGGVPMPLGTVDLKALTPAEAESRRAGGFKAYVSQGVTYLVPPVFQDAEEDPLATTQVLQEEEEGGAAPGAFGPRATVPPPPPTQQGVAPIQYRRVGTTTM